jgi:ferredoxin--NADP+ reductase
MYTVIKKRALAEAIVLLEIEAPDVAKKAQAGQFVIVRQLENSERIPLTIMDFNREKGTVTIVLQAVGYSSGLIAQMREGEHLLDFVGPLGQPTEIENYGTVLCVAAASG